MKRSQVFIDTHRRGLKCASEYYNVDSELMPRAAFETAAFRLLVVFPADVTLKGKSMTRDVINDFIQTKCPHVFVDFCYMPCEKDRVVFDRENISYLIGNITHLDASHYDGIGFSLALNHEGLTAASMLATCSRCDTPIPLTWSERRSLPVGHVPLIWCGGMAASVNDICFGDIGDGRQAFFDFAVLGDIYCEVPMFQYLAQIKGQGNFTVQEAIRELWRRSARDGNVDLYHHIYQPQAYRVVYDSAHAIVENSRIDTNAPEYCVPYRAAAIPEDLLGAARTIISGNGANVNDARIMVASGCTGSGACTFCHEGNYVGGYSEVTAERGEELARAALRYTAADTFRPWAYNITSLSHLGPSIHRWREIFPRIVFNNTRMDDLAAAPALIGLFVGDSHHIYAPIEGISDRIRNSLLNKGVSTNHIDAFFKEAAKLSISICKVGFIYTGYEEASDWEEFRHLHTCLFQSMKGRGANFPLRYKGTLLVHYPHTPAYYLERKAARLSFEGRGVLTSPQFRKCLAAGMRMKINGFKYGTFIEQAVLDLGRSLTAWFYTAYIGAGVFVESFRSIRNDTAGFAALRSHINTEAFFAAKPLEALTPVSCIRVANHSLTLRKAGDLLANGLKARFIPRCLRSFGNTAPQCGGCGLCKTAETKGEIMNRPLKLAAPAPHGPRVPLRPIASVIRLLLNRKVGYEALNPRNTVYLAVSRLLQVDATLIDAYRGVMAYSTQGMSGNGEQYPFRGYICVDVAFTAPILETIITAAQRVNSRSASFKIIDAEAISPKACLRSESQNRFRFEASMKPELWAECCASYRGALLTTEKGMRKTIYDPSLQPPTYHINPVGHIIGEFELPVRYSPWAYLQGIYTGHKIAARKIFENFDLECIRIIDR